jgi:hypothetical protein
MGEELHESPFHVVSIHSVKSASHKQLAVDTSPLNVKSKHVLQPQNWEFLTRIFFNLRQANVLTGKTVR